MEVRIPQAPPSLCVSCSCGCHSACVNTMRNSVHRYRDNNRLKVAYGLDRARPKLGAFGGDGAVKQPL